MFSCSCIKNIPLECFNWVTTKNSKGETANENDFKRPTILGLKLVRGRAKCCCFHDSTAEDTLNSDLILLPVLWSSDQTQGSMKKKVSRGQMVMTPLWLRNLITSTSSKVHLSIIHPNQRCTFQEYEVMLPLYNVVVESTLNREKTKKLK